MPDDAATLEGDSDIPRTPIEGEGSGSRQRTWAAGGARIRQARTRKGLTRAEVGLLLGVSESAVQQWESGYAQPRPDRLEGLAKWLDVSIEWLLTGGAIPAVRSAQTPEEEIVLRYYRRIPAAKRPQVMSILSKLATEPDPKPD